MKTQKIVLAALLAALICVTTVLIKVPLPFKGYLNLGDSIILLSAAMLSPLYAALAAGIGSALADIYLGYVSYALATFVIKAAMAVVAYYGFKFLGKLTKNILAKAVAGVLAEAVMVFGYFVFEGFLYGFAPSAVNIPANAIQGLFGVLVGVSLIKIFEKSKFGLN